MKKGSTKNQRRFHAKVSRLLPVAKTVDLLSGEGSVYHYNSGIGRREVKFSIRQKDFKHAARKQGAKTGPT